MRIACWIRKATNTLLDYVVLTDFHCNKGYTIVPQYHVIRTLLICYVYQKQNLVPVLFRRVPGHIIVSSFFKTIFGILSAFTCLPQTNFPFEVSQQNFCTNLSSLLCQLHKLRLTFATNISIIDKNKGIS
jgi:hypothetical protein